VVVLIRMQTCGAMPCGSVRSISPTSSPCSKRSTRRRPPRRESGEIISLRPKDIRDPRASSLVVDSLVVQGAWNCKKRPWSSVCSYNGSDSRSPTALLTGLVIMGRRVGIRSRTLFQELVLDLVDLSCYVIKKPLWTFHSPPTHTHTPPPPLPKYNLCTKSLFDALLKPSSCIIAHWRRPTRNSSLASGPAACRSRPPPVASPSLMTCGRKHQKLPMETGGGSEGWS